MTEGSHLGPGARWQDIAVRLSPGVRRAHLVPQRDTSCVRMAVPSELCQPLPCYIPFLFPVQFPSTHHREYVLKRGQDSNRFWSFWAQFRPRFCLRLAPSSDHINAWPCPTHWQLATVPILTTRGHKPHTALPFPERWGSPRMGGQRTKTLGMGAPLDLHRDAERAT